jgi:hypothetical protein
MQDFGRDYRKERLKRVIALKEIHDEVREQQRKTRANLLEIDPNAILPELSGICGSRVKVFFEHHQQLSQIRHFGIRAEMMN